MQQAPFSHRSMRAKKRGGLETNGPWFGCALLTSKRKNLQQLFLSLWHLFNVSKHVNHAYYFIQQAPFSHRSMRAKLKGGIGNERTMVWLCFINVEKKTTTVVPVIVTFI